MSKQLTTACWATMALVAACAVGAAHAADWVLDASTKKMTEVVDSGIAWVLNVSAVDSTAHTFTIGSGNVVGNGVSVVGDSTLLDLTGSIADAEGTAYAPTLVNGSAFRGKSTLKEVRLADSIVELGGNAFRECSSLTSVRLPSGIRKISGYCFYSDKALATLSPMFPDTLSEIEGDNAFSSAVVGGEMRIASPDFKVWNAGNGFSKITLADFSESGITNLNSKAFVSCASLKEVRLPPTLQSINGYWQFYSCKALTNVVMQSLPHDMYEALTTANYGFSSANSKKLRVFYNATQGDWASLVARLTEAGKFIAWDDCPESVAANVATSAGKADYKANFDAGKETPIGLVKGSIMLWLVPYTVETATSDVTVSGNVLALSETGFVNGYGDYQNVSVGTSFAVPEYAYLDGIAYRCDGYRFEKFVDGEWMPVSSGAAREFAFSETSNGNYRIVWQWREHAYSLSLADFPASCGTLSVTPPNFQSEYYLPDTLVKVTVAPADPTAEIRWYGDVPDGTTGAACEIMMDARRRLTVYVRGSQWIYDDASRTVSNGYWTFKVSGSVDALTIGAPVATGTVPLVDFSTGVVGGSFSAIGDLAFSSASGIDQLVLPDSLSAVGNSAFYESSVKCITPCLPESVTSIGWRAFYGCSATNDFTLPAGAGAVLLSDPANGLGFCRGAQFASADLSKASVTVISNQHFRSAGKLRKVVFPKTLSLVRGWVFYSAYTQPYTLVFKGGPVTFESAADLMASALNSRYVVPSGKGWEALFAGDGHDLTRLTQSEREAYAEKFPGSAQAKYKVKYLPSTTFQYVVFESASTCLILK